MADEPITVEETGVSGTFARPLTEFERQALTSVIGAELIRLDALAATAPHQVHAPPSITTEIVKTYDPGRFGLADIEPAGEDSGGPFWEVSEDVVHAGLLYCPDCHRELQAGNDPTIEIGFLICPQVPPGPLPAEDRPCHEGCTIACGRPD